MFLFVRISLGIFLLVLGLFIIFSVFYPPWRRKLRNAFIEHWESNGLLFMYYRIFFKQAYYENLQFKNSLISFYIFSTGFTGIGFIALAYLSFTGLLY